MPKDKPGANHVITDKGTLHSEHATIDQANAAASAANSAAKNMSLTATYIAVEGEYNFGE
jgi:hypothetical protein